MLIMVANMPPDHMGQHNKRQDKDRQLAKKAKEMGIDLSGCYNSLGLLRRGEVQKRMWLHKIAHQTKVPRWQKVMLALGAIGILYGLIQLILLIREWIR